MAQVQDTKLLIVPNENGSWTVYKGGRSDFTFMSLDEAKKRTKALIAIGYARRVKGSKVQVLKP